MTTDPRNCVTDGGEHCLHWPVAGVFCCRCDHDTRTEETGLPSIEHLMSDRQRSKEMPTESITIPLRTGAVVLTNARQHGPERTTADRITLVDPTSGVSLSMPRDLFNTLADARAESQLLAPVVPDEEELLALWRDHGRICRACTRARAKSNQEDPA